MADDDEDIYRPRPFWSGVISFGLVTLPVSLFAANRGKSWSLKMVDSDGVPLKRVYFCEKEDKPLTRDEIVRGYEVEKGEFLVVDDDELRALAPEKSHEIDLRQFVALDEVEPVFFGRGYFLVPDEGANKAYRLLARCMEEEGRAGIATFVMRDREYLVAIVAANGILKAETLRFSEEVRTPEEVGLPEQADTDAGRVNAMKKTIAANSRQTLERDDLADDYARRLEKLVASKQRKGKDVVESRKGKKRRRDEQRGDNVIDLMEVLKERMRGGADKAKPAGKASPPKKAAKGNGRTAGPDVAKSRDKKKAGASRGGKPQKGGRASSRKRSAAPDKSATKAALEKLSREELYRRAQAREIEGRSRMTKQDLIKALRSA